MKKLFTLLTLTLLSIGTAWGDGAITVSFAYDKINANGTGTISVNDVIESTSVALTGLNASHQSFNGTSNGGTYNSITVPKYSKISVDNTNTSGNNDGVRFTITPAAGCTFTPTSISLGAIREGTDGGSMYVYVNNSEKTEASLNKSPVTPGRNKTGETDSDITKYTKDGYTFSYSISSVTADPENPLTIDVCLSGLKNKSWGLWNVVITGTYTKVAVTTYALTTTANPTAGGSINRSPNALTYTANKSVTLTAIPNYGYEFVNWTKGGVEQGTNTTLNITTAATEEEYVANFNALATYALTANAGANGSVSKSPNRDAYTVGDEVTLTATPDEGYYFINWTDDNNSNAVVSTNATYAYTTTSSAASYTAHFGKSFTVTYNIDDYNNTTTKALTNYNPANSINEKYADKDGHYTIPSYSHYYMYREGYIFSKWEDQDGNQYDKGTQITLTKDITLTPVWVATTQTLANSAAETTVTWKFEKNTILFNGWQYAPQVGYYTKPLTVNGELIAVPMIVNTTSGKVDNSSRTDALAQVNGGTTFTIPAIKGMTVVLTASNNITNTTVAGNTPSSGSGTKTATYNYTGENGTAVIDIKDGSYYEKIVVTYPQTTIAATISKYGKSTFSSSHPVDIANATPAGLKAYKATAATASSVHMVEVTEAVAGMTGSNKTGLVLVGTPNTTYYIPIAASGTEPSGNLLFGWNSSWGNIGAAQEGTNFVLSVQEINSVETVVWAPVKSDVAPISEGQAALWANVTINQSRSLRMTFGDNSVTGISEVAKVAEKEGKFFEDGKLVIVKNGKKFNAKGQLVK